MNAAITASRAALCALCALALAPTSAAFAKEEGQARAALDFSDRSDFDNARRGFIAALDGEPIRDENGKVVYDYAAYDFLKGDPPEGVNKSLWRQGQLNAIHGLFEVTDGIYQLRGYDLSNVTFIRGKTGWIVVDPLITRETAAAALALVNRALGKRPISAVVYTHSHIDHYGGVRGIVSEEDVAKGVAIVAPANFVRETVSENILAGNAMARRATYMFGGLLPKGPDAQIGTGLGQAVSTGRPGMIAPTTTIEQDGEKRVIDGVEFEFILTRDAEAPTEFMFYLPQFKAFCQAEIINHTLHNLLTPRGAKVRDGRLWSQYIDEALVRYGDKAQISFGSHHWPTWGNEKIRTFWTGQRDLYRYIHDQTLRLANQGYTINEIPSRIELPPGIAHQFANRGYYGTVSFNARAQYQLYLGFFDGNPANLDPPDPVEEGRKFVEYMGGAQRIIALARRDLAKGDYRFAARALNHLVFAQPDNRQAAELLAEIYTRMADTTESGPWRNFYLTGAKELREGVRVLPATQTASPDVVRALPLDLFFDLLAVRLNGPKAAQMDDSFNFLVTDSGEHALLILSNGTLHHRMGQRDDKAPTLKISSEALVALNTRQKSAAELFQSGGIAIEGDPKGIIRFFSLIEEPEFWFEIVRP